MGERRARSWRVLLRRVHLWMGLSLGLLVALAGLTGSALIFYPEIDNALVPALRAVPAHARPASWQAVYDRLRHDYPARKGPWRIEATPDGGPILTCQASCGGASKTSSSFSLREEASG